MKAKKTIPRCPRCLRVIVKNSSVEMVLISGVKQEVHLGCSRPEVREAVYVGVGAVKKSLYEAEEFEGVEVNIAGGSTGGEFVGAATEGLEGEATESVEGVGLELSTEGAPGSGGPQSAGANPETTPTGEEESFEFGEGESGSGTSSEPGQGEGGESGDPGELGDPAETSSEEAVEWEEEVEGLQGEEEGAAKAPGMEPGQKPKPGPSESEPEPAEEGEEDSEVEESSDIEEDSELEESSDIESEEEVEPSDVEDPKELEKPEEKMPVIEAPKPAVKPTQPQAKPPVQPKPPAPNSPEFEAAVKAAAAEVAEMLKSQMQGLLAQAATVAMPKIFTKLDASYQPRFDAKLTEVMAGAAPAMTAAIEELSATMEGMIQKRAAELSSVVHVIQKPTGEKKSLGDKVLHAAFDEVLELASAGFNVFLPGPTGCLHGDTVIVDPVDGSRLSVKERWVLGCGFHVWSRTDTGTVTAMALPPVRYRPVDIFEVIFQSGRRLKVTGEHRLWSGSEYVTIDAVAKRLRQFGPYPIQSIPEPGQSIHISSDRRSTQRVEGCLIRCPVGRHSCDGPLRPDLKIDQENLPSRGDSQQHIQLTWHRGDQDGGYTNMVDRQSLFGHRPMLDYSLLECMPRDLESRDQIPEELHGQSVYSSSVKPQLRIMVPRHRTTGSPQQLARESILTETQSRELFSSMSQRPMASPGIALQSQRSPCLPGTLEERVADLADENFLPIPGSIFLGSTSPSAQSSEVRQRYQESDNQFEINHKPVSSCSSSTPYQPENKIVNDAVVAVNWYSREAYYDFHVPVHENYWAESYFHHNCGKTHLCKDIADALEYDFGIISGTAGTTEAEFLGTSIPNLATGENVFIGTEFLRIYEEGGVFLLDEGDAMDANCLLKINAAISNGFCPVPKRYAKPIAKRHERFVFIMAANTWGTGASRQYCGRNKLDEATLDRFRASSVPMDYDFGIETRYACPDRRLYDTIVGWRKKVRDAGMQRIVSTRFMRDAYILNHTLGKDYNYIAKKLCGGWSGKEIADVIGKII